MNMNLYLERHNMYARVLTIILLLLFFLPSVSYAKHQYVEKVYQRVWCNEQKGVLEVVLDDGSRIDCLTDTHAVEVDFARKWPEAVGQALYYAVQTQRKAGILLILETPSDEKYLNRLKSLISESKLQIDVWTITPQEIK